MLAWPRSPLALSWLTGGILFLGLVAVVHAARAAWRIEGSRPARVALALVAAAPGVYLLAAASVVLVNTQLVVVPARLFHARPAIGADERAVALETSDGYRLGATYTPGVEGAGAVLLVHGVSDGRDRWLPWVARLRAMDLHVLRVDVRAHGTSEGAVVTYGQRETRDVEAALAWLRGQPSIDGGALAMAGTSMGGGIVLAASERARVRAVIALAPASSYPPLVAQRTRLLGPLRVPILNGTAHLARAMGQRPMTSWRPAARMSRTLPVLVAHGGADRTIDPALSRALAAEHPNVRLIELACGHDEIPAVSAGDDAWPAFEAFLAAHLGRPAR
ncbi:MAG: alpha/beta fold hydrolase [Sandaracinaceae bacterium]|nr:alpha/beta fold hydrolase [Sandaracinaceae bacterium]